MNEEYVIQRIKQICRQKQWSIYKLSQVCDIPHSTLHNMFKRATMPTLPTLMKICDGFGITVAQFFLKEEERMDITREQEDVLRLWDSLDQRSKELAEAYLRGLAKEY